MAAPTPKTYFAPGWTWTTEDADVVWVEITSYVLLNSGIGTDRGRSSETDDDQSGTLRLRLKNTDRRFDPTHAAGPYFGDLKPGVPVKVEADADGNTYPIFRGFIDAWPQDYDSGNTFAWVSVSCTDGLAKLATAGVQTSTYALEVAADSPEHWWRLNESAGRNLTDSGSDPRPGSYTPSLETTDHPNPWEAMRGIVVNGDRTAGFSTPLTLPNPMTFEALVVFQQGENGQACYLQLGDGTAADGFSIQAYFFDTSVLGIQLVALSSNTNEILIYEGFTLEALQPGDPIHLVIETGTPAIWINGEEVSIDVDPGSIVVASGMNLGGNWQSLSVPTAPMSIADVAVYDGALADARIIAHANAFLAPWDGDMTGERIERLLDLADWPTDLRDVATGLSPLGPAVLGDAALALLKRAEGAEQGRLFISRDGKLTFLDRYYHATETQGTTSQATFSDDGADEGYSTIAFDYDTTLVKNRVKASRQGGSDIEVTDATSISEYGDRTDSGLTGLDFDSDFQARSAAEFRLLNYKQPSFRVRPITVPLHGMTEAQQATLLGLELGQRVTVERTPQGVGSAITQECSIEGIAHNIADLRWTTTFRLAPIPDHMDEVALWGTGEWDTEVWGY